MKFFQARFWAVSALVFGLLCPPAIAQFGGLKKAVDKVNSTTEKASATAEKENAKAEKVNEKLKDIELTEQEEVQIGEKISAKVREKYGVVQDPAVHKYVTLVGTALARKSTRSTLAWHFIVLDTDGVNAFAAPGGYVHITRGTLALMKSEAQLAGVLGHEVGHVVARHASEQIAKSQLAQTLVGAVAVAGSDDRGRGQQAAQLGALVAQLVQLRYGRQDELQADALGVDLMSDARYHPQALVEVMAILARAGGRSRAPEFLSSHPDPGNRQQRIQEAIAKKFPNGVPPDLTAGRTITMSGGAAAGSR